MKTQRFLLKGLALAAVLQLSCGRAETGPGDRSSPERPGSRLDDGANVLARVNGVPITEEDVRLKLARDSHQKELTPKRAENVLEAIIRQELIRQRAVELGLDADPRYRERLRPVLAQLSAFEREQLGQAFYMKEILNKAEVGDDEVEKHFEDNADLYRTEFHLLQILHKGDEAQAQEDLADLEAGMSFAEVARRRFPNLLAAAGEPWDLGYLKWPQIPKPWREQILELKPGERSGLIRGPSERVWIIELVDRRQNAAIQLETHRAAIAESLKAEAVEALKAKTERELRDRAQIEYTGNALSRGEE